jgi:hypothetical protein
MKNEGSMFITPFWVELAPGTDVTILKNFAEKFSENIGVFDSKQS